MPIAHSYTCDVCGHHPPDARQLEVVQGALVCVDVLGCIARGLDTAIALGQKMRQLRLFDA